MPEPYMQSPLAGVIETHNNLTIDGRAGVEVSELDGLAHLNVRGSSDDAEFVAGLQRLGVTLAMTPNTVYEARDHRVFWLGPDEWLLTCDLAVETNLYAGLSDLMASCFCSVTEVSGGQTIIRLSGRNAVDVLAKGCTIDLHPRVFAPGQCAQTNLAKTVVLLRPCVSNTPAYEIIVRRSFADYLWQWILKSAVEYGYVIG